MSARLQEVLTVILKLIGALLAGFLYTKPAPGAQPKTFKAADAAFTLASTASLITVLEILNFIAQNLGYLNLPENIRLLVYGCLVGVYMVGMALYRFFQADEPAPVDPAVDPNADKPVLPTK